MERIYSFADPPSSDRPGPFNGGDPYLSEFDYEIVSSPKITSHPIMDQQKLPPLDFLENFQLLDINSSLPGLQSKKPRRTNHKKRKRKTILMRPFANDDATDIVVARLRKIVHSHDKKENKNV